MVDDTQLLLLSAQRVLVEKNSDEKMQRFLKSSIMLQKQFPSTGMKNEAITSLSQVIINFQELVLFIVRNPEFRSLLLEFVDIVQVMLGVTPPKNEVLNGSVHLKLQ